MSDETKAPSDKEIYAATQRARLALINRAAERGLGHEAVLALAQAAKLITETLRP